MPSLRLVVALVVAGILPGAAIGRADFPIAADGKPACAIVAGEAFKQQAGDLAGYLAKITGATIPVVADVAAAAGRPVIILEKVERVPGSSTKVTARQAYRITADATTLRLTGGSDFGVTYAVWGLLEDHLGCRFYTFQGNSQPGFEIVPQRPALALPAVDDFQEPAFMQRSFIWWPASSGWVVKNRGGGYPGDNTHASVLMASHNFYKLLPPDTWFKDHPEWAPLTDGKREPHWAMGFCYSNPDLAVAMAESLRKEIEKVKAQRGAAYDPAVPISFAQGDGFAACECDTCRAVVAAEDSWAGPLILMCNRALELVGKDHPRQTFITHAYFETLKVPRQLRPHANLYINLVSSDLSQNPAGDNVGRIAGNPAMRAYAEALQSWPKIAPGRVTVWDWRLGSPEWPTIFYLADNERYFQACDLAAVLPQPCSEMAWRKLFCWLHLKLAWNPQADADRLIRQYLADVYGPKAAAILWDYFKLTQAAYEDSLSMPSVCRSTGWTETMNAKMYQPFIPRMAALMDQALAAANSETNPVHARHMAEAMAGSIDPVRLADAKRCGFFGVAQDPTDGRPWWVPGGDAALPAVIRRLDRLTGDAAGDRGGPLVEVKGGAGVAAVCPPLKGQIVGYVPAGGRELFAALAADAGYRDELVADAVLWRPPANDGAAVAEAADAWSGYRPTAGDRLDAVAVLWKGNGDQQLRRTVRVTDAGLTIERKYVTVAAKPVAVTNRFTTRWLLALPDPKVAKVSVTGGGIAKLIDLQYAVPGGIRGIKAGTRPRGVDYMDKKWDDVAAVSDAEVTRLPVAAATAGDVVIQFDRGDGTAVVLTTPSAGWEAVEIRPVVGDRYQQAAGGQQLTRMVSGGGQRYLEIRLVGGPVAIGPDATAVALPVQTLAAQTVPRAEALSAVAEAAESARPPARLEATGANTAVNEIDGSEMVWVPAGEFLRGSPDGRGAGDERPQKKITLDGFWIARTPVTRAQYEKFCAATGRTFEPMWAQGMRADPAADRGLLPVMVNWYEAADYAAWAGAALPSEAQWERAARGTDGRDYPWGDEWDAERCVSKELTLGRCRNGFLPVGSIAASASPCGALDMAGSVWEWTADWYDYEYYRSAPDRNPTGPTKGSYKSVRGGCAMFDERFSRTAARFIQPPQARDWTPVGFRCIVAAPGPAE
jgi:sulfatase modifying factor 1